MLVKKSKVNRSLAYFSSKLHTSMSSLALAISLTDVIYIFTNLSDWSHPNESLLIQMILRIHSMLLLWTRTNVVFLHDFGVCASWGNDRCAGTDKLGFVGLEFLLLLKLDYLSQPLIELSSQRVLYARSGRMAQQRLDFFYVALVLSIK